MTYTHIYDLAYPSFVADVGMRLQTRRAVRNVAIIRIDKPHPVRVYGTFYGILSLDHFRGVALYGPAPHSFGIIEIVSHETPFNEFSDRSDLRLLPCCG